MARFCKTLRTHSQTGWLLNLSLLYLVFGLESSKSWWNPAHPLPDTSNFHQEEPTAEDLLTLRLSGTHSSAMENYVWSAAHKSCLLNRPNSLWHHLLTLATCRPSFFSLLFSCFFPCFFLVFSLCLKCLFFSRSTGRISGQHGPLASPPQHAESLLDGWPGQRNRGNPWLIRSMRHHCHCFHVPKPRSTVWKRYYCQKTRESLVSIKFHTWGHQCSSKCILTANSSLCQSVCLQLYTQTVRVDFWPAPQSKPHTFCVEFKRPIPIIHEA